jgi:ArsR family transcriptional regulator, arsenate/arsenite/antimonite-responsive transcriptional repressor
MDAEQLAECFKAMGDQTRIQILALLKVEDLCVCELVEILGISQPSVSQHIRKLKNAKLVKERRQGKWIFYSLDGSLYPYIHAVLDTFPDLREKIEELKNNGQKVICD